MAKQWTEVLGGGLTGGSSDVLKYSLIVQASGARGWMSRPRRQHFSEMASWSSGMILA